MSEELDKYDVRDIVKEFIDYSLGLDISVESPYDDGKDRVLKISLTLDNCAVDSVSLSKHDLMELFEQVD